MKNSIGIEKNCWDPEISSDAFLKIISFIVSPFLGFLLSIRRINTKSSFIVFFLFAVFFGLNLETSIGKDETHKGDAAQYRLKFEYYKSMSSGDVSDVFVSFRTFNDERNRDIYVPIMSFLSSRISGSYHVFFALLAVVFSYFMLKTLKFITDDIPDRKAFSIYILLYIYAMTNSIFNINGCRFWTAAWIAVYCIFQIYRNNNKRYFILAAVTPLIHASYWFFLGILAIAHFFGKARHFWKIFFFLSFILSTLSMQLVVDISDYLPPSLQFLVERYTSEEREVKTNLYQVLSRAFTFAFMVWLTYVMYLFMKHEKFILNKPKISQLYPVLLVLMSICNFAMAVPSLGGRYMVLGYPLVAYIWYHAFERNRLYRNVIQLYPLVSMMGIYELLYCYLNAIPLSFYYTSPLYQFYKYIILGVI